MKPPEILLGNKRYTLTADVWATGAIFAGLVILIISIFFILFCRSLIETLFSKGQI